MNQTLYVNCLLNMTTPLLTAEEKYFLIRLSVIHGLPLLDKGFLVSRTINELENELGMTETQIKKAREGLIAKGLLIRTPSYKSADKKQGRPREGFRVVALKMPDNFKALQQFEHQDIINSLLLWDSTVAIEIKNSRKSGRRKDSLSPVNRITLAVLLMKANACGVIRNLGYSQLAKLAGLMTQDRLDSQLNKLTKLGYIYSQVAGVTGTTLFGRQTGAIFLNLFDHHLLTKRVGVSIILLDNKLMDFYSECHWAAIPFRKLPVEEVKANQNTLIQAEKSDVEFFDRAIQHLEQSLMYENYPCKDINQYYKNDFRDKELWAWVSKFSVFRLSEFFQQPNLMSFIQYKINNSASELLSKYWNDQNFEKKYINFFF